VGGWPPAARRSPRTSGPVTLLLLLAACGGGGSAAGSGPGSDAADTARFDAMHAAAEHQAVWSRSLAIGIDDAADVSGEPSTETTSFLAGLDHLLREQVAVVAVTAIAADDVARTVVAGGRAALQRLEDDLVTRFEARYDRRVAERLREIWHPQTLAWVRYADAAAVDDREGIRRAREELDRFTAELPELVADITSGRADPAAIDEALDRYVEHVADVVRRVAATDQAWLPELPAALDRAAAVAESVGRPVAADLRLEGDPTAAATRLRTRLDARMTDAALVFAAFVSARAAGDGATDGATDALEATAAALADAVGAELGDEAARRVDELWRRHQRLLRELADRMAAREDGGGGDGDEDLDDELAAWAEELGRALEDATGGALARERTAAEAVRHVDTMRAVLRAVLGEEAG
jgi:hypothetical protein